MATVSISEAARLAGKSRKTIQRYVADGRISMSQHVAGERGIDIAELVRVFGTLSQPDPALSHATESQPSSSHVAPNVATFETRIAGLEAALAGAREVITAKNETIDGLRQAIRLLEGPVVKRPWWRFGR
jgi:hypothetical protein